MTRLTPPPFRRPATGRREQLPASCLIAGLCAAALWLPLVTGAAAALEIKGNLVTVTYGTDNKPNARITFSKDRAARRGVVIETFRAGAAGSKLSVQIDKKPVFTHVFGGKECSGEGEAAHCMVTISGLDARTTRVRDRFRRGRISRLNLETGGIMSMQLDVSLEGFGRAMQPPEPEK